MNQRITLTSVILFLVLHSAMSQKYSDGRPGAKLRMKWSHRCIGLPSVVSYKSRLAVFYDAPGGEGVSHMRRSVGLAWLGLPLFPPKRK